MERHVVGIYVRLGGYLRYLRHVSADAKVHGDHWVLGNLTEMRRHLITGGFPVSVRAFDMRMGETIKELTALPADSNLTPEHQRTVNEAMRVIETALLAEADGKEAFIVRDRRYPVASLLSDVGSLFGPRAYSRLPALARLDFDESGRALAFDLPTAAAFHALRALEGTLRAYYEAVVRRKRIKEPRMWAALITDLRKRKHADTAVLDRLDYIRVRYRNPTDHPEKAYDADEALDLFGVCIDAINVMSKTLPLETASA